MELERTEDVAEQDRTDTRDSTASRAPRSTGGVGRGVTPLSNEALSAESLLNKRPQQFYNISPTPEEDRPSGVTPVSQAEGHIRAATPPTVVAT